MLLYAIIISLFFAIHLIEVSAFFARSAGVSLGKTALGYALQNSVFMLTRIFTTALFPLLGFVVDSKVSNASYLSMVFVSLFLAALVGLMVVMSRSRVVYAFSIVIKKYEAHGKLIIQLLFFPIYFFGAKSRSRSLAGCINFGSFFVGGLIVFGVYSLSVFIAFFFGLVFYDYRATISQLSGITNALATVLLTFYIEPKISSHIDKKPAQALDSISSLMAGRVFGTFIAGIFVLLVFLLMEFL